MPSGVLDDHRHDPRTAAAEARSRRIAAAARRSHGKPTRRESRSPRTPESIETPWELEQRRPPPPPSSPAGRPMRTSLEMHVGRRPSELIRAPVLDPVQSQASQPVALAEPTSPRLPSRNRRLPDSVSHRGEPRSGPTATNHIQARARACFLLPSEDRSNAPELANVAVPSDDESGTRRARAAVRA